MSAIGQEDEWEVDKLLKDDSDTTEETNKTCRKYFASFYVSNRYANSEFLGLPKIEFPDFWKLLFGGFEFPEFNPKLLFSLDFQFDHKIVKTNPFDKNDELCED